MLAVVDSIPPGRVMTYGDVAATLGSRAARMVGQIMAYYGSDVPWWRVVRASGHPPANHEHIALQYYRAESTPLLGVGTGTLPRRPARSALRSAPAKIIRTADELHSLVRLTGAFYLFCRSGVSVHRFRLAAAVVSASVVIVGLTGCSVLTAFAPHVDSAIFDTAKELTPSATSAFGSPTFIPADATIIRVDYDTQNPAAILTYTSKTHFATGTCTKPAAVPKPAVQDSWWPTAAIPAQGVSCPGGWSAFVIGNQVYAARPAA